MPFNFSMDAKVFVTYSAEQDKSLELRASDVDSFHEHVQDVKMIVAMPCVCFFRRLLLHYLHCAQSHDGHAGFLAGKIEETMRPSHQPSSNPTTVRR